MLLRDRMCALALIFMFLCSAFAIHQGNQSIAKLSAERDRVSALLAAQNSDRANDIPEAGADAGDLAYYSFYAATDSSHAWSFIALGNRSFEPPVQRIRMLGLQGQLYDGQVQNPEISAVGSFDFAFIAVFLLPLLCIVLGHNVLSSERETGRLALLQACAKQLNTLALRRACVRAGCAFLAIFLPLLGFAIFKQLPALPLLYVMLALLAYTAFWTFAALWLAPAHRSSAVNAVRGLTLWTLLVLVLPQLGQMLINQLIPVPQGKQIALAHRQSVASAWDIPKHDSFKVFFGAHPEWQNTAPVLVRFHWKWYFAFHHAADMQLAKTVEDFEQRVRERQRAADALAFLSPSIALQAALEIIADSRIERVLAKRKAILEFHTQLRRYFYPYIFEERLMTQVDFLKAPKFNVALKR